MEKNTKKLQKTKFEIFFRVRMENSRFRIESMAGWITLIIIVGVKLILHFMKGAH